MDKDMRITAESNRLLLGYMLSTLTFKDGPSTGMAGAAIFFDAACNIW